MSEKVRLSNDLEFLIQSIKEDSASNTLVFVIHDVSSKELEEAFSNSDATSELSLILFDDSSEFVQKKYADYTSLVSLANQYNVVISTDFDTRDATTQSGYAEVTATVSTVKLSKKSLIEATISDIQAAQEAQDSAIEDLAEILSSGGDA